MGCQYPVENNKRKKHMSINATEQNFEEVVLKAVGKVVVDFWAPWCGPCTAMAPLLEQLSGTNKDITVVKIDIDQNPTFGPKYNIRGIPTLVIFENGEIVKQHTGMVTKQVLDEFVK